jgi:putative phosphoesterase
LDAVGNLFFYCATQWKTGMFGFGIIFPGAANSNIMFRVGLISDTHGLLRPEAELFLNGCDYIVHSGDIGHPRILEELARLAPVTAVRGNIDRGHWSENLPEASFLQVGELVIYAIHDPAQLEIDPCAAGVRVVVSGHSHRPSVEERDGVLFVNPGSSGPRRFKLPVSVGEVMVTGSAASARIVELLSRSAT